MRLVVDLCKISIMGLMMTIFAPTKLVLIIGLWIGLLHKLSFIRHFGNVILGKIRIIALKLIEAVVRKWCKI